jgi:hypothetical protein
MRGYLKAASLIPQCTRCFSLREISAVYHPTPCQTCAKLLKVAHTKVQMIPFGDLESDMVSPTVEAIGCIELGRAARA